ncbi:hypothetical protein QTP81_14085 [Alteromonas sp. ASW11-36]|uniref:DUF998 domain-containing protein n=1 Tax=Alteromonas arenosi TaxID=3055817 RepID=A0ABT7SZW3_9ALTE|nr:hypothetical protein [Alteromonas sp. ASW11-36]MDM7861727.1 hypothetical protein [Alteromonas sp. ASW11-36]
MLKPSLGSIALWCALLPTLTVHITWPVAAATGALHWCNPYWSHCHSISATGREVPQFYIFKLLMLPSAALMLAYWTLMRRWLVSELRLPGRKISLIYWLGIIACVSLIMYTLTLGAVGDLYALPRRMGVVGYFAFTAFAHLLLLNVLAPQFNAATIYKAGYRFLYGVCSLLLLLGVTSALLGFVWPPYDNWDNAFEWWFAVLMVCQFAAVSLLYNKHPV